MLNMKTPKKKTPKKITLTRREFNKMIKLAMKMMEAGYQAGYKTGWEAGRGKD
jgi:hypothetical protein